MDALEMLREDHRKVKELFRQFEETNDKTTLKGILDNALVELEIHSALEEEIFYPALRRQGDSAELVAQAREEHHAAEMLMGELGQMDARDPGFGAKFRVLAESVKAHIEEEESQMLPRAAEAELDRLERLGERMAERKQALLRAMQSRRPQGGTRRAGSRAGASSTSQRSTSRSGRTAQKRSTSRTPRQRTAGSTNGRRASTATRSRSSTASSNRGRSQRTRPSSRKKQTARK